MKVKIDSEQCQGHGRCYDLAPDVFGDDEEGYGKVLGDGTLTKITKGRARVAITKGPRRHHNVTLSAGQSLLVQAEQFSAKQIAARHHPPRGSSAHSAERVLAVVPEHVVHPGLLGG